MTPTQNNNYLDCVTYQGKAVIDILRSGNTYIADYLKISYGRYQDEYKELSKLCNFNNCPIFCVPLELESKFADISGSRGGETNKYRLILRIPTNEFKVIEYYDFSDYLYFSKYSETEIDRINAFNNINHYVKVILNVADAEYPEIVIDRIDPNWIIKQD